MHIRWVIVGNRGDCPPPTGGDGRAVFSGVSTLNLDAKGRIAIPAKHRETLAESCASRVVVTVNPFSAERCLLLYPNNEWQEVVRRLSRLPAMSRASRAVQRMMVGFASELELDGQGRILLSNEQREFARLGKRISLVGQMNKFEIWDAETWSGGHDDWMSHVVDENGDVPEELRGLTL